MVTSTGSGNWMMSVFLQERKPMSKTEVTKKSRVFMCENVSGLIIYEFSLSPNVVFKGVIVHEIGHE